MPFPMHDAIHPTWGFHFCIMLLLYVSKPIIELNPSGPHSNAMDKVSNNVPFLEVILNSFTKSCLFPMEEPSLSNHGPYGMVP
jgi:hypothetical protein